MKYQNVILRYIFAYKMKSYENLKCDANVRIKIKKLRLFIAWLFGVDLIKSK